jgi:hypothetical protein
MSKDHRMSFPLQRRHLLLAPLAYGLTGGSVAATPLHPDLALKLMIVGRRKPGTTLAEHRQHIRHVHGELVRRYVAVDPAHAPRRYAQNAVFDGFYRSSPVEADPFALNRDFVTEIWFPDFQALGRSRATPFYKEQLQDDENNFVDQATVVMMPTQERLISSSGTPVAGAFKVFFFVQRAAGVEASVFTQAWAAAAKTLANGSAGERIRRHVQNDPLPGPKGPAPVDGIDEFWFDDETSARALLAHWQGQVQTLMVQTGVAQANAFALIANEALLHPGPVGP